VMSCARSASSANRAGRASAEYKLTGASGYYSEVSLTADPRVRKEDHMPTVMDADRIGRTLTRIAH
jgi:hypothetical protein